MPATQTQNPPATALLANRAQFKAFVISRVGNEADAEDILQNGLVKALRQTATLRDDTKITAWFFQLLRNAVVDHVRSRESARARELAWTSDVATATVEEQQAICRCFEPLVGELKPRHAALLRLVELEGTPVADAAVALGISANNASVTLHRARAALRSKLEQVCGECAQGACLDCDCADKATG